eukprot:tig00001501_g9222.t1
MRRRLPTTNGLQYLHDKGFTHALAALEEEAGRAYEPDSLHRASALLAALSDAYEAEMLRGPGGLSAAAADDDDLNEIVGAGVYPSEQKACIEGLHTGNILTVRFSPHDLDLVATGGSDRSLRLILSVDFHPEDPDLLLSCGMDGKARIYSVGERSIVQTLAAGTKYAVRARWAPDASFFCIASYDKHLRVYRAAGDGAGYAMVAELAFVGTVEAVEVLPGTHTLVAACRDSNFLEYIDLDAGAVRSKVNMNINGDNVVSFTAMDLAASPNEKYLSVSTDKSRIIVFRTGTGEQVRNLYGASNDAFAQPRHAWHPSGHYVHGTGQDNAIHVWDLRTSRSLSRLAGHTGVVRDVHFHPREELLASCSFDKTVRLWASPPSAAHAPKSSASR